MIYKWKTFKLSELGTVVGGATPSTTVDTYYNGDIPWLTPKDLSDFHERYIERGDRNITKSGLNSCSAQLLPAGSVLFSSRAPIGYVAIAKNPIATNQGFKSIIPNPEKIDSLFLYYLLKYNRDNIEAMGSGTTFKEVSGATMKNIEVYLPEDLNEQRRIAGILGSLDDKIELNRRINANLEAQAQALFKSWFVDFEPFRDGPFVDSELGKIPASLKMEHIGNMPHKIESGKRPKGGASEYGIPSIGAENIKGLGIYDYSKTKFIPEDFASTMKKGKINGYELLIYKDGGKPGYFIPNFTIFGEGFPYEKMYINEHVFCLDFFNKGFNVFAYFYMRTPYIMNQLNTIGGKAAIPGINTKDIESLPIFTQENKIVKEFGSLFLPTIRTILQNCVEIKTLSALRDSLLPKLLTKEICLLNTIG